MYSRAEDPDDAGTAGAPCQMLLISVWYMMQKVFDTLHITTSRQRCHVIGATSFPSLSTRTHLGAAEGPPLPLGGLCPFALLLCIRRACWVPRAGVSVRCRLQPVLDYRTRNSAQADREGPGATSGQTTHTTHTTHTSWRHLHNPASNTHMWGLAAAVAQGDIARGKRPPRPPVPLSPSTEFEPGPGVALALCGVLAMHMGAAGVQPRRAVPVVKHPPFTTCVKQQWSIFET